MPREPDERMTAPSPDKTLEAIRREIDSIDDEMLQLLERRFAATGRVKATKTHDGSIAASPFRPAREAMMLRRLISRAGGSVPPDVLVRLWRVILSASTQLQAPVTLHLEEGLSNDPATRLMIGQHFCGMTVAVHGSAAGALDALRSAQGDVAILGAGSDWAEAFSKIAKGTPSVIGTLPVISGGSPPQFLVFGHAEPQASGDDETLILCEEATSLPSPVLWQAASGRYTLASLPGFLGGEDPLLRDHLARRSGAIVAGRCPRPIKVST